jgi:hypothetical protein
VFVSLLSDEGIFLARADRLEDPWEGALSEGTKRSWTEDLGCFTPTVQGTVVNEISKHLWAMRRHTYLSCWHKNEQESAAMWKLYLKSEEGIAVQTTFGRLKSCLEQCSEVIQIGRVQYRDYSSLTIPGGTFAPYLYKRLSTNGSVFPTKTKCECFFRITSSRRTSRARNTDSRFQHPLKS